MGLGVGRPVALAAMLLLPHPDNVRRDMLRHRAAPGSATGAVQMVGSHPALAQGEQIVHGLHQLP